MKKHSPGFTLIELLTVMAIIVILAGLVLGTSGYVQKKGARSRAEAEIAALSAALESYKADNGIYPNDGTTNSSGTYVKGVTDSLDARNTSVISSAYAAASKYLYGELSGDRDFNRQLSGADSGAKAYFEFKPNMLTPSGSGAVTSIVDPFGNSYGYSTAYQGDVSAGTNPPTHGYNPTFDLWSTGGQVSSSGSGQWLKNW